MLFRGLTADEVAETYRRYGVMLERRCRLLLRDEALAEDAMQELLATLLRRGEGLREAKSAYAWLCRAADRASLDVLRRARRTREAIPLEHVDELGPAPGVDADTRHAVLDSLASLAPAQQSLAIMLFVDGLSQSEAASELGVSRVTINKRAQEIRALLRLRYEDSSEAESAPDPPREARP